MIEASLRSINVGSDTPNYVDYFYTTVDASWDDLFTQFVERYVLGTSDFDVGFFFLGKIVSIFTNSFQIYTFVTLTIYFVPIGLFLMKYTKDFYQLTFALVFFLSLYLINPLSGGRQMQAYGMAMLAIIYVGEDKYIKSAICVLIGVFFHMSIILIVPYIVICYFKPEIGKKMHFASFFLIPVVFLFSNQVIMLMGSAISMEKYKAYGEQDIQGGTNTFIALASLISFFSYIALKSDFLKNNTLIQKLYVVLPFITVLAPLIRSNGTMIRIGDYFNIYLMVFFPYSVDQFFKRKDRKMVYILSILAIIILSLRGANLDYDFFWNDPPGTWRL